MSISAKIKDSNTLVSLSASVLIHLMLIILAAYTLKISTEKSTAGNSFVQIRTGEINNDSKSQRVENKKETKADNHRKIRKIFNKKVPDLKNNTNLFLSSDTAGLYQVYKESTLDVSIRYPVGWTYIDQDVRNKLDGVTFWATNSVYSPPPYVHIEVKDKYLFNKNRYKHSIKTDDYTAYYNDPEELSGQISQEVYIRTGIDEDFSIKLIMEGMDSFKNFQPVFFGMIKTFKFDNSLF
ncbi:MAG: hypothetical protein P8Z35_11780 [Ignavibacteriaceae bacterium]